MVALHQSWSVLWGNPQYDSIQNLSSQASESIKDDLSLNKASLLELPLAAGPLVSLSVSGGELFVASKEYVLWGDYRDVSREGSKHPGSGNVPSTWKRVRLDKEPVGYRNTILRDGDDLHVLAKGGRHQISVSSAQVTAFSSGPVVEQVLAFGESQSVEVDAQNSRIRVPGPEQKKLEVRSKSGQMAIGWSDGLALVAGNEAYLMTGRGEVRDMCPGYSIDRALRLIHPIHLPDHLISDGDAPDYLLLGGMDGNSIMLTTFCTKKATVVDVKKIALDPSGRNSVLCGLAVVYGKIVAVVNDGQRYQWVTTTWEPTQPYETVSPIVSINAKRNDPVSIVMMPREEGAFAVILGPQDETQSKINFYRLGDDDMMWKPLAGASRSVRGLPIAVGYADGRLFVGCNRQDQGKSQGVVYVYEVEV